MTNHKLYIAGAALVIVACLFISGAHAYAAGCGSSCDRCGKLPNGLCKPCCWGAPKGNCSAEVQKWLISEGAPRFWLFQNDNDFNVTVCFTDKGWRQGTVDTWGNMEAYDLYTWPDRNVSEVVCYDMTPRQVYYPVWNDNYILASKNPTVWNYLRLVDVPKVYFMPTWKEMLPDEVAGKDCGTCPGINGSVCDYYNANITWLDF